jgi:hypothetical protein
MGSTKSHRNTLTESMQRNKRMASTLGCLVASMTLGAFLLDWFQPKPSRPGAEVSHTTLISLLQPGIAAPGTWRSIQLDSQSPGESRSHFVINREGQISKTDLWQRPEGAEGVIRIGLISSDNSNEATPSQWSTANELIQAIQHTCGIPREQIHFDTVAAPSVPTPAPSRHINAPRSSRRK